MISLDALKDAIAQRISEHRSQHSSQHPNNSPQRIRIKSLLESNQHILAEDIKAPFELPRQPVSSMDGFAFPAGSDLTEGQRFDVIGESVAGKPYIGSIEQGQAIAIMTGAVVPSDCESVVMKENLSRHEQSVEITITSTPNTNIRYQGEEIATGETLMTQGTLITPAHITLLASMGLNEIPVFTPLKVAIIASGDELRSMGEPLEQLSQIYNSNTPSLQVLLKPLPIELVDYGVMPDDFEATKNTLTQAANECDVVITSAGVSVGDYDYLTRSINELGRINHYKVAMKPGKPFVFGELPNNAELPSSSDSDGNKKLPTLYFGLPGNPLSTFIGALLLVRPALWQLAGSNQEMDMLSFPATASATFKKRAGRRDFQRGIMSQQANGAWQVEPIGAQDSHRVKGLSLANCLVDLPEGAGDVAVGDTLMVIPLNQS